jgi:hypothetical protein
MGMTRIAWGKGKREVLLLKVEINALFAEGATVEEAYRTLSDRLTVSKPTFRRHAAVLRRDAFLDPACTEALPSSSPSVPKPKSAPTPVVHKVDDGESLSTGGTFSYDPSATDEDLW